jgi:hypothetical protein
MYASFAKVIVHFLLHEIEPEIELLYTAHISMI